MLWCFISIIYVFIYVYKCLYVWKNIFSEFWGPKMPFLDHFCVFQLPRTFWVKMSEHEHWCTWHGRRCSVECIDFPYLFIFHVFVFSLTSGVQNRSNLYPFWVKNTFRIHGGNSFGVWGHLLGLIWLFWFICLLTLF